MVVVEFKFVTDSSAIINVRNVVAMALSFWHCRLQSATNGKKICFTLFFRKNIKRKVIFAIIFGEHSIWMIFSQIEVKIDEFSHFCSTLIGCRVFVLLVVWICQWYLFVVVVHPLSVVVVCFGLSGVSCFLSVSVAAHFWRCRCPAMRQSVVQLPYVTHPLVDSPLLQFTWTRIRKPHWLWKPSIVNTVTSSDCFYSYLIMEKCLRSILWKRVLLHEHIMNKLKSWALFDASRWRRPRRIVLSGRR
jgi:hypothetical protein